MDGKRTSASGTSAFLVVVLAVTLLGTAVLANGSDAFMVNWYVQGGAGGIGPLTGSTFSLNGTAGQNAIGPATGGTFVAQQGYWYGAEEAVTPPTPTPGGPTATPTTTPTASPTATPTATPTPGGPTPTPLPSGNNVYLPVIFKTFY